MYMDYPLKVIIDLPLKLSFILHGLRQSSLGQEWRQSIYPEKNFTKVNYKLW